MASWPSAFGASVLLMAERPTPDAVFRRWIERKVEGYRAELRDEGRVITAANEVGDLYVDGPSAALMYWGDRGKSRDTFQGAWTRTGDKYFRDDDGYYVYAGRSDDMYGTLAQIERIAEAVPQTERLVLDGAGHSLHRDQPERLTRAVHEFLARHVPPVRLSEVHHHPGENTDAC